MEVENNEVVDNEISTDAEIEGQELATSEEVNEETEVSAETETEESEEEATDETDGDEAVENEEEAPVFTPNTKFKANDKEMDIPQEYHSLMKDAESEKAVRELFEKAHGIDSVKTKLADTRVERDKYLNENTTFKTQMGKARQTYAKAVQNENYHSLDGLWKQLSISPEVVMRWAHAKAQLAELAETNPAQHQLMLRQIGMEQDAEAQAESMNSLLTQNQQHELNERQNQFDNMMATPQVKALEQEFEQKFGLPGAFQEEVLNAGKLAYANGGKILSVAEAVQAVTQRFGLGKAIPQGQPAQGQPAAAQAQPNQPNPAAKKVVQRTTKVIPNTGGASHASPIKTNKPRSIADIEKLRDKAIRGEQV